MTSTNTATVETIAAEVRVLTVGSHQVNMSVYNQLDWSRGPIEFFGRVNPRDAQPKTLYLVGREESSGTLVRARRMNPSYIHETAAALIPHGKWFELGPAFTARSLGGGMHESWSGHGWDENIDWDSAYASWAELSDLPLIVLAGLR